MVWTIIGIIILSGIYRLYLNGKKREAEQKRKMKAVEAVKPEIDRIQRDLNDMVKKQKEMYAKKAQDNWDNYVQEQNIGQYLNNIVSIKSLNKDKFYKMYVWRLNNKFYYFIPRPSVSNESELIDTLENLSYPENMDSNYRVIDLSPGFEFYRRDGYCQLVQGQYPPIKFKISDYDTLYRILYKN